MGRKTSSKTGTACYGYSTRAKIALSGMAMFPLLLILLIMWRGVGENVSENFVSDGLQLMREYTHSSTQDIDDAQRRISELSEELDLLIKDVMVQQASVEKKCKDVLVANGIVYDSLPDNPFNTLICEQIPSELIISESHLLSCDEILRVLIPKSAIAELDMYYEFVSGVYDDNQVMLHWVSPKVTSVKWCLGNQYSDELRTQCYKQANLKLIQEITLLKRLKMNNIVKLKGYCMMEVEDQVTLSEPKSVIVALENGKKFDIQEGKKQSFEDRIKFCVSLFQLLVQMSTSTFGPIRLANVSDHQFIITADGHLKLHHVLSLQYEEPSCSSTDNCTADGVQSICSPLGKCTGYNTKKNIQVFTEKFFVPLLTTDIPSKYQQQVSGVLSLLRGNKEELAMMQDTLNAIHSSVVVTTAAPTTAKNTDADRGAKVVEYEMIPNADFHGRYDYKCPRTRASWGCVLSVYGLNNAKKQCTYDEQCKAFTVIAHYARPGWFTTFFKDAVDADDNFDSRPGANLFIKHVKYESDSESTVAASVTTEQSTATSIEENGATQQTDTESIPFNNMLTRKESDNEFIDRKQVDAEEEVLKQIYERGDGGAGDGGAGDGGAAADGEDTTTTTRTESTQVAESHSNQHDCFSDAMAHLGSVFRKREAHLMDVCDWEGMSDDKWTTMLKGANISADLDTSSGPPIGSKSSPIRVKLQTADGHTCKGVMKTVTTTHGHMAQMLYYLLDRKLGFYNALPTASRMLSADEFKSGLFTEVQGNLLEAYNIQVEVSGQAGVVLSGMVEKGSYDTSRFHAAIKPLPDIAWAVTQLTKEQQSYLDNIYMGWLAGLDPFSDNTILVKGYTVNINSEDAFHTWNHELLNYANSCHFPRHLVQILKYAKAHNCSLSAQLSSELQSISLHVDAVHTLSYTDEHGEVVNPLLNIDKAATQLLERANKCTG